MQREVKDEEEEPVFKGAHVYPPIFDRRPTICLGVYYLHLYPVAENRVNIMQCFNGMLIPDKPMSQKDYESTFRLLGTPVEELAVVRLPTCPPRARPPLHTRSTLRRQNPPMLRGHDRKMRKHQ
jgi:hypothetical protein